MPLLPLSILDTLIAWDTQISLAINGIHSDYADSLMEMFSGKWVWVPCYLVLCLVVVRSFHRRGALLCLLLSVVLFAIDDQLSGSFMRHYFERMRPSNPHNPISVLVHVVDGYRGGRFGFPSAHATNTWGITIFTALLFRHRYYTAMMALWALLVCYSRIYLGVHYFGDIMGGLLLGLFNATVVYLLLRRFCPSVVRHFRSSPPSRRMLCLPVAAFAAEIVIMAILALFIDPAKGI